MYSNDQEKTFKLDENYAIDSDKIILLEKLRLLRIDCAILNNSLEKTLKLTPICKNYSGINHLRFKNYLTALQNRTHFLATFDSNSTNNKNLQNEFKKFYFQNNNKITTTEDSTKIANVANFSRKHSLTDSTKSYRNLNNISFQKLPFKLKKFPIIKPTPNPQINPQFEEQIFTTNSSLDENFNKTKRLTRKWYPKITISKPFQLRSKNSTNTYAKKFLQKMLDEKRLKEVEELKELAIPFKANPIPKTTYVPDTNLYIGKLKKPSLIKKPLKSQKEKEKLEEFSKKNFSRPVPLTTFINPSTSLEDLRKIQRNQRAINMLMESVGPTKLEDHQIRSKIQHKIRHHPRCFQRHFSISSKRSKSVPDFRRLHQKFQEGLHYAALNIPPTIIEPFHFEPSHQHYCWNWTEKEENQLKNYRQKSLFKSKSEKNAKKFKAFI